LRTNLVGNGVPLDEVQEIIDGYLEKGCIRKLTKSEAERFDLPWFPVVDQSRDSTPVQLVFDAQKTQRGRGLSSKTSMISSHGRAVGMKRKSEKIIGQNVQFCVLLHGYLTHLVSFHHSRSVPKSSCNKSGNLSKSG
jgi:hypothetical protein